MLVAQVPKTTWSLMWWCLSLGTSMIKACILKRQDALYSRTAWHRVVLRMKKCPTLIKTSTTTRKLNKHAFNRAIILAWNFTSANTMPSATTFSSTLTKWKLNIITMKNGFPQTVLETNMLKDSTRAIFHLWWINFTLKLLQQMASSISTEFL